MSRVKSVEVREWNDIQGLIQQRNSLKNVMANQEMDRKKRNNLKLQLLSVEGEIEKREDLVRRVL